MLTMLKPLRKLKNRSYTTFDVETDADMVEMKCLCISKYNPISNKHFKKVFYNIHSFFDYLFDNNINELYAYNLKFDARFFLNYIKDTNTSMESIRGGSNILSLFLQKNDMKIRFRDFYPMCLSSLDSMSKIFDLPTRKYPVYEENNTDAWNLFFKTCTMKQLIRHCFSDVKMLAELIHQYRVRAYRKYGLDVCNSHVYSLAGLAMKLYRTKFLVEDIENPFIYRKGRNYELSERLYYDVRNSYRGGYAGNIDNDIHYDYVSYDISSSYPYQATILNFPVGTSYYTTSYEEFSFQTSKIHGFCKVDVYFDGSILFPVYSEDTKEFRSISNKWSGWLTSIELQYLEECNIDFDFKLGIYFTKYDTNHTLKNYMLDIYEDKKNATNPAERTISKRLLTNLTGKFGQKVFMSNRVNERILTDIEYKDNFDEYMDNNDVTSKNLKNGYWYLYNNIEEKSVKCYTFPAWISLITASGRIQLLKMINLTKAKLWDSDSVYFNRKYEKYITKSKGLGSWEKEHDLEYVRSIAPKFYAGYCSENDADYIKTGIRKLVRSKGISIKSEKLRNELFDKIMKAETNLTFEQFRPLSIRSSLIAKNVSHISETSFIKSNKTNPDIKLKVKN